MVVNCFHLILHIGCHELSAIWDFIEVLQMHGCSNGCASRVHNLTTADVLITHDNFVGMSQLARKQWVLDYLHTSSGSGSDRSTTFTIRGKSVCFKVWSATLNISQAYYYNIRALFLDGHQRIVKLVQKFPMKKTSQAMVWMDTYFKTVGDHMPDRGTVHLPSSLTKQSVYNQMRDDMERDEETEIVGRSQFFKLWDTHFNQVSIPKVSLQLLDSTVIKALLLPLGYIIT